LEVHQKKRQDKKRSSDASCDVLRHFATLFRPQFRNPLGVCISLSAHRSAIHSVINGLHYGDWIWRATRACRR